MIHVEIDFETRSPVNLKTCGAFVYFETWHAAVLCAAYSINGSPVKTWRRGEPCPADLRAAIEAGATISAHNAQFETLCFVLLSERCGWPMPRYDQFRCTAATAAAMSLPRALDDLSEALGLTEKKDKEGKRLIEKFSKPRRPHADEYPNRPYWNEPEDHPEDFDKFVEYCAQDVRTESAADHRMVPLSDFEQSIWLLDQKINRRGIRIDVRSAQAAIRLAEKAKFGLDREMSKLTDGYVKACSQPAKLTEWVAQQGVEMASMRKGDIVDLLECDDLPDQVRKALKLRQEAAKTSVAKLKSMLDRAGRDNRVRGSFMYWGAGPGRWTSMGVNFANMPRPRKEYENAHLDTSLLFEAFRKEDPEWVQYMYGPDLGRPLHLVSDAIRGFVWAAPGHDLLQADYSGIEGVVAAWLSDETWKIEALREINADPENKADMYRRTAAGIMGTTTEIITKKHPLRQSVGKVSELALGFGGGVGAFYSMAKNYNVKLDPLFGPVWEAADDERRDKAVARYEKCLKRKDSKTDVLSREAWLACEIIKVGWRKTNPAIAASWYAIEKAIRDAIRNPGVRQDVLKLSYIVKLGFLWCRLPSGRCLAYGSPKLRDQVWAERLDAATMEWLDAEVMDRELAQALERRGLARIQGETSPRATVLGVDGVTKRWTRYGLYGSLSYQNDVQAIARDLLVNGMLKAEDAGYPVIAHVYDEIITEVPRGFGDVGEFERLICELPEWGEGIPLIASGWRGKRYRKD